MVKATAKGLAALLLLAAAGCTAKPPPPEPRPVVVVATPLHQQIADWDDYSGRFEAFQSVEVRPRVSGLLESVRFRDGEIVRKGQLLFTIDPRPFAARLAQARAQVSHTEAALANARSQLTRTNALLARRFVSQAAAESQVASERQATADLAAARAAADAAALDLSFTQVRAPIGGRASFHRLAAGNLVTAETTLLTTIMSVDPIRFVFDAPEAALLKYERRAESRAGNPVEIRLQDETAYRWKGRMQAVDNALDQGSGTIRGEAIVANPTGFLVPGMFGQMRWISSQPADALLIPDDAVVTNETQQVVYAVNGRGIVVQKPVELGRLNGGLRVVRSGLAPADRVIISGVQRAKPGRRVDARAGTIGPSTQAGGMPRAGTGSIRPLARQPA